MSQEYSRGALRVVVAQLCQQMGWNSIHAMPLELLTDVLERYLLQLGRVTHTYSEQFGQTTPRLADVFLAFSHLGVRPSELKDYACHMDLVPFAKEVVAFPVPSQNDLKFPNPDSREVQQRKVFEFVPEHLPYMHPELNEDFEDSNPAPSGSPERLQVESGTQFGEMSPGQGDKRPLSSPGDPGAPFKRPRLTTSQLPEEALHSQHEMKSVVMTNSGILSPLREGKLPDTKPPPSAYKQIVIVKQKSSSNLPTPGSKLPTDTPIIKLDFSHDKSNGAKIVEVETVDAGAEKKPDRRDPDFHPKKKKIKIRNELKKAKLKEQVKQKRGPGRPKSPGRAVIHNKGSAAVTKILQTSLRDGDLTKLSEEMAAGKDDGPMDLSVKPPPPVHNISVHVDESARSKPESVPHKIVEYRPKVVAISKQQEKDMEDTIASVIENSRQADKYEEKSIKKERSVSPHEKKPEIIKSSEQKKDTWRVSVDIVDPDDSFDTADDDTADDDRSPPPQGEFAPPGQYVAPHLAFLHGTSPPSAAKPRGRPRGSTLLSMGSSRSPRGSRRPGRPPLNRSPGRAGSGSLVRSPGRPPLSRSPGRPPLNRSPGRPPGSGRSPGRPPKISVPGSVPHSPKPRGRPRGSKSPRNRGFSPRGGSPRAAVANINFDENVVGVNSRILQEHPENSETRIFDFPESPDHNSDDDRNEMPSPGPPRFEKVERSPSPGISQRADRSPERRDVSPAPDGKLSMTVKREPTPDTGSVGRDSFSIKRDSSMDSELSMKNERHHDESSNDRPVSRGSERREHSLAKQDRSQSREKENRLIMSLKERSSERETSLEKERVWRDLGTSSERERSVGRGRDRSQDRERKEHSKDRERDRDTISKDRDRERSKDHKKDKKKKKKKDRDKDRERDKDRKDKHDKHKKEKEAREESPSVAPLQKLTIKFGSGSKSSKSSSLFSIATQPASPPPPRREPTPPPPRPEIPKLKFKMLPPKPGSGLDADRSDPGSLSWQSTVKTEARRTPSPKPVPSPKPSHSPKPESYKSSPKPADSGYKRSPTPSSKDKVKKEAAEEEEKTVSLSVIGGKIQGQKPLKRKRKGSKAKAKGNKSRLKITPVEGSLESQDEDTQPAMEDQQPGDPARDNNALSPIFSNNQDVPSPVTIPALKAAPPPPSPPTNKKSPPKPKSLKDSRSQSPLLKDITTKPKPPPVKIPKSAATVKSSPRRSSPRKSPKVSPPVKKKGGVFSAPSPTKTTPPPSKSSSFSDSQPPRSPSTSRVSSPSFSPIPSPMYSPSSSPARNSPLHFMIPPTPAFPTRTTSPPLSPPSRQVSTDEEKEATPPVDRPEMPPPLPPMPPSATQKKAQRTVVAETVGSFVNESGEKVWICPACTMQDDGSPMIGCDLCDDWYHWPCVNITEEPGEEESWYCPKCVKPNKSRGKRGRKKKKP